MQIAPGLSDQFQGAPAAPRERWTVSPLLPHLCEASVQPTALSTGFSNTSAPGQPAWRRRIQSLELKGAVLVVLLILGITTAGTVLSARAMRDALYESEFHHARERGRALATAAATAYSQDHHDLLRSTAQALVNSPTVAYVAFAEADGRILTLESNSTYRPQGRLDEDGRRLKIDRPGECRVTEAPAHGLYAVDLVLPVPRIQHDLGQSQAKVQDVIPAGYVLIGVDISPIRAHLQRVNRQLIRLAAILVLLVIPISLATTRYVVAPLNELARTARAIANGSVDERAQVDVGGEIGELAEAFNTMTDRVVSTHMDLLRLNADLERRVHLRTQELARLAASDSLTGLYNRRHFGEIFQREFAASRRHGRDLTCMMLDLDHFKETNDRFGHRMGDEILILLARSIESALRESDLAARFGGDEFVVMLPQASDEDASPIAERIRDAFNRRLEVRYPDVPVTLSIGIASRCATQASSAEDLIHEADVALYAAKDDGRDRVAVAENRNGLARAAGPPPAS